MWFIRIMYIYFFFSYYHLKINNQFVLVVLFIESLYFVFSQLIDEVNDIITLLPMKAKSILFKVYNSPDVTSLFNDKFFTILARRYFYYTALVKVLDTPIVKTIVFMLFTNITVSILYQTVIMPVLLRWFGISLTIYLIIILLIRENIYYLLRR